MNSYEYGNVLRQRLLSLTDLRARLNGDNTWVMLRCPFCGDSKTDMSKTRFYVKVALDNGEIPICYCHNCGVSTIIDKALPLLFPDDYELETNTQLYYKQVKLNPKHQKINLTKKKNLILKAPMATQYNLDKIQYINNRLGIKIGLSDLRKYKIVIDLPQVLFENGVKNLTRDKRIVDVFRTDYMGFLTVNNEYVNMRNIKDSHKINKLIKRYENYNVFNVIDNSRRFYAICNNINRLNDIEIHIAEGPFDILGVYNHIMNKDDDNKIYVAVCGSGYKTVINNVLSDYGILFADVHIYSDNEPDKDVRFYKNLKRELGYKINSMTVYYNQLEKDFGVRPERIKMVSRVI